VGGGGQSAFDGFGLQPSLSASRSFFGFADLATAFILRVLTPGFPPFRLVATLTVVAAPQALAGPSPTGAGSVRALRVLSVVTVQPEGSDKPTQADTWKAQDPSQALADALVPSLVKPGLSLVTTKPA